MSQRLHMCFAIASVVFGLGCVSSSFAYDGYYNDAVYVLCNKTDPVKFGEEVIFTATSPNSMAWITLDVSGGEIPEGETNPKTGVGSVSVRVVATSPGVDILVAQGSTTTGGQAGAYRSVYRFKGMAPNPINIPAIAGKEGKAIATYLDPYTQFTFVPKDSWLTVTPGTAVQNVQLLALKPSDWTPRSTELYVRFRGTTVCTVPVNVIAVTLSPNPLNIPVGESGGATATIEPSSCAGQISFAVSLPNYYELTPDKASSSPQTITITSSNSNRMESLELFATLGSLEDEHCATIKVNAVGLESVTVDKTQLFPGQTAAFQASPNPSDADWPSGYPKWKVVDGESLVSSAPEGSGESFSVTIVPSLVSDGTVRVRGSCGKSTITKNLTITAATLSISASTQLVDFGQSRLKTYKGLDEGKEIVNETKSVSTQLRQELESGVPDPRKVRTYTKRLRELQQQLREIELKEVPAQGLTPAGNVKLQITGTSGRKARIVVSGNPTAVLPGQSGFGGVTPTEGTVPFEAEFAPNGNYGDVTITVEDVLNPELRSSITIRVTGQTAEEALREEDARKAAFDESTLVFDDFATVLLFIGGGLVIAAIATAPTVFVALALLALLAVLCALAVVCTALARYFRRQNNALRTENVDWIKKNLPTRGE